MGVEIVLLRTSDVVKHLSPKAVELYTAPRIDSSVVEYLEPIDPPREDAEPWENGSWRRKAAFVQTFARTFYPKPDDGLEARGRVPEDVIEKAARVVNKLVREGVLIRGFLLPFHFVVLARGSTAVAPDVFEDCGDRPHAVFSFQAPCVLDVEELNSLLGTPCFAAPGRLVGGPQNPEFYDWSKVGEL